MSDPYTPPNSSVSADQSTSPPVGWNRRQLLAAVAASIAIVMFSIASFVLIAQALRLASDATAMPARFQADFVSTSRSSWIGGVAAAVAAIANAFGLLFVRNGKPRITAAILVVSFVVMFGIAIAFKPV